MTNRENNRQSSTYVISTDARRKEHTMTHKMMISAGLAAVLFTGLATTDGFACDPNGPRGGFALGIPAADNPVWCETTRPGFAMSTTPAPERTRHARRLRHR